MEVMAKTEEKPGYCMSRNTKSDHIGSRMLCCTSKRTKVSIASTRGKNDSQSTVLHPYTVSSPPDKNEPNATVPNTIKSLTIGLGFSLRDDGSPARVSMLR